MAAKSADQMTREELRWHQCGRKAAYRTRALAKAALKSILRTDPSHDGRGHKKNPLSVYSCPWVAKGEPTHYHIGHRPTR